MFGRYNFKYVNYKHFLKFSVQKKKKKKKKKEKKTDFGTFF